MNKNLKSIKLKRTSVMPRKRMSSSGRETFSYVYEVLEPQASWDGSPSILTPNTNPDVRILFSNVRLGNLNEVFNAPCMIREAFSRNSGKNELFINLIDQRADQIGAAGAIAQTMISAGLDASVVSQTAASRIFDQFFSGGMRTPQGVGNQQQQTGPKDTEIAELNAILTSTTATKEQKAEAQTRLDELVEA